MSTIPEFFENSAKRLPNKTALVVDRKSYTYKELYHQVQSFSSALLRYPKKSVISIMFENSLEFIVSYLGILKTDCIAHLVLPNIADHNLLEQIQSANPRAIIVSKELSSKIQKIEDSSFDKFEFSELMSSEKQNDRKPNNDETAYLIYTSGTTSVPKGVGISHANAIFTVNNIVSVLRYTESDIDVLPLPLSHSFGLGCMHTSFYIGSTLILHKNMMDVNNVLDSILSNNATTFAAVPTTLTKLLDYPKLSECVVNLRLIITNSAAVPTFTINGYHKILKKGNLATYYGLTEASRSTFMIFDKLDGKEESVGLPAPGVQIKIVNEENQESVEGTVWIKGGNVIKSYWKNSDANKNIIDGWLKTGDVGYLDPQGYLFIKGRLDDVINVGGEKVVPEEVERIVKTLPGIDEAVAIGVKHKFFGQVVKLFVQKSPSATIQKSEIISYCIKNLERYKVPTQIEFIDEIPRTEYGKIKRFKLE